MNAATSSAVAERHGSRPEAVCGRSVATCRRWAIRATGSHATRPRAATTPHSPSDSGQEPSASATGTVTAEATPAPPIMANIVSPVARPVRWGWKNPLTSPGIRVPASAIPTPATRVPRKSGQVRSPSPRSRLPTTTSATAAATTRPAPNRCPTRAATGANRPMHNTGTVVSTPISAPDSPRSVRSAGSSGGSDAIRVRREKPTPTSPATTTASRTVGPAVRLGEVVDISRSSPRPLAPGRRVHDDVGAVPDVVGAEQLLLVPRPAVPLPGEDVAVAAQRTLLADRVVGLQPDHDGGVVAGGMGSGAHALQDEHLGRGDHYRRPGTLVGPVPCLVCRRPTGREGRQDVAFDRRHGRREAVPARVDVVEVEARRAESGSQQPGIRRLARSA